MSESLKSLMDDSESDDDESSAELKSTQAQLEGELGGKPAPVVKTEPIRRAPVQTAQPVQSTSAQPAPAQPSQPSSAQPAQNTDYIRQLFSLVRSQVTADVYQKITVYVKKVKESTLANTDKRKKIMAGLIE
jgi:hypothetical protein